MNKVKCLLFAILVASLVFVGCGKNTDGPQGTENTQVPNTIGNSESEAESTESVETETTDVEETESESEAESESESEKDTETDSEEEKEEEDNKPDVTYTYTDMDKVMYVVSSVNIRSLPSTDGTKVGSLSKGTAVQVTGVCNETGWYRFEYNGANAYVSPSYLNDEKPTEDKPSDPSKLKEGEMMTVEEDGKTYEYYNWNGHIVRMLQSTPQARKNLNKAVAYANYGELIIVDGYAASKWSSSPSRSSSIDEEWTYLESLGYTYIDYSDIRWSSGGPYTYINMYKISK